MKSTFILLATLLLGVSTFAQKTIVLVHGAWANAAAWNDVSKTLKSKGYEVLAVNLPGHGADTTSPTSITLQTYVDVVKKAIGNRSHVILVGHSMAGFVISEVAEQIPDQIQKLVYVAAFLPRSGETLLGLSQQDAGSHIGKYLQPDPRKGIASIASDGVQDLFAADAPQQVVDYLVAHNKPEPLTPFTNPVTLTDDHFGKVSKAYVYTVYDQAISYAFQQEMVQHTPIERVYAIPSSHTPFLSEPGVLAAIIAQEAH